MEVDCRLEMLRVPEAVGHLLDGLNLGVKAFTDGVGHPMSEEGQDVWQVPLNRARDLDDRSCTGPRWAR